MKQFIRTICIVMLAAGAHAQQAAPAASGDATAQAKPPVLNSNLDAPLFYQLLIGEIELSEKLGRNDPCPCGSGRRFQEVLHDVRPL